jgi:hypothetical protein
MRLEAAKNRSTRIDVNATGELQGLSGDEEPNGTPPALFFERRVGAVRRGVDVPTIRSAQTGHQTQSCTNGL